MWRFRSILISVRVWIKEHTPVKCYNCDIFYFEKSMKYEKNMFGNWVAVCPDCHKDIFTPFTRGSEEDGKE